MSDVAGISDRGGPVAAGNATSASVEGPVDAGAVVRPRGLDLRVAGSLHLVRAKLRPPLPAATCVPRPSLVTRIDAALHGKLLLLAAPVGSGKTTLLTHWHDRATAAGRAVAWLSLDKADDEPARFFAYLVEAIRCAVPAFDACIPRFNEAQPGFALTSALAVVAESLGQVQQELVIVIDDFQWLAKAPLLHAVDFLLSRSPTHIRWVLSGRCMPALNLGPLRLSEQLSTLDALDLAFNTGLVQQLSHGLCRRELLPEEAECIMSRTEGWVAGVKLALLAATDPRVANCALHPFAGSQGELAQYLGASLLQEQTDEVREFLVASSVVDRMTGDLCNAVLGISNGQALLDQLERSQLFIQPLDSQGQWYRYHTFFLDFLRSRLRREAARLPGLHERASMWFAEHQLHDEALAHAFAANNPRWRLELVARCVRTWRDGGEIVEVIRWCERLPRADMMGHEDLGPAYISSLILARRFEEAAAALDELAARGASKRARAHQLHLMLAVLTDDSEADAALAGDLPPAEPAAAEGADRYLAGSLLILQAYAQLRRYRFDQAWRLAMRARDTLENVSLHSFGYASAIAALAERARGDVKAAASRIKQMFSLVRGGRRNPAWVNAATGLAHVRYEENRLVEAEALCTELLPLLSAASAMENFATAHITLARLKVIAGRHDEAFQLLDYLHSVLECGHHRRFLAQVCGEKLRLCLAQDDLPRARKVLVEFGVAPLAANHPWQAVRPYDEAWERFGLAQAMLQMHQQDHERALAILAVLRDSARAVGYAYREQVLEAGLAVCHWEAGHSEEAFRALNRGLALARGLGFPRSMFDEWPALPSVLFAAVRQRRIQHPLPVDYFGKFETACSGASATPAEALPLKRVLPLEPLTDREIGLLRLLARGLSNHEISAQSQIALSTAKWHLKNVFAKLDVNTRTGAIARARQLQIIE